MNFFIQMNPPTATAQEKKVRVVHGKPLFFDPAPVKQAKQELTGYLMPHKPNVPLEGPLSLSVIWLFPKGKVTSTVNGASPARTQITSKRCSRIA